MSVLLVYLILSIITYATRAVSVVDECPTFRDFFKAEEITNCKTIATPPDTKEWIRSGGTILALQDGRFYGMRPAGAGYKYLRPCIQSPTCHIVLSVTVPTRTSEVIQHRVAGSLGREDTIILTAEDANLRRMRRKIRIALRMRRNRTRPHTHFPSISPTFSPTTSLPTSSPTASPPTTSRPTSLSPTTSPPTSSPTSKKGSGSCTSGCLSSDGLVCYVCGNPTYPPNPPPCGTPPCSIVAQQIATVLLSPTLLASSTKADLYNYVMLALTQTNQIYENSLIPIRLNIVQIQTSSFDESGDSYTDLVNLRAAGPPPGGANMAVLLVQNLNSCGRAYVDCTRYPAGTNCAFAVVKASCAVGYYSFGHEIGHIQGADHNYAFRSTTNPRFTYGYGYILDSSKTTDGGQYRTVMAYAVNGETRVAYISNPDVSYLGAPTGVADQADNARVLRQTRLAVAAL